MTPRAATIPSSTHPEAPLYLPRGLFDRLKTFRELEELVSGERLRRLTDPQSGLSLEEKLDPKVSAGRTEGAARRRV